jgi:hypothetical protein
VNVGVTGSGSSLILDPFNDPEFLVSTPDWNAGKLFHIEVDELAGMIGFDSADDATSRAVHPSQAVDAMADEHAMHGRCRHIDDAGKPGRAELS